MQEGNTIAAVPFTLYVSVIETTFILSSVHKIPTMQVAVFWHGIIVRAIQLHLELVTFLIEWSSTRQNVTDICWGFVSYTTYIMLSVKVTNTAFSSVSGSEALVH